MEYPCDTCKHVDICSLDSDDYQCSAVFIFRQLNKDSLRGMLTTISLGYNTKKAYKKNLQYVKEQFKKIK